MNMSTKAIIESVIHERSSKNRIISPEIGSTVCIRKSKEEYTPVRILDGKFYGTFGGVSNFWTWVNLETNEVENGYGCFYKMEGER